MSIANPKAAWSSVACRNGSFPVMIPRHPQGRCKLPRKSVDLYARKPLKSQATRYSLNTLSFRRQSAVPTPSSISPTMTSTYRTCNKNTGSCALRIAALSKALNNFIAAEITRIHVADARKSVEHFSENLVLAFTSDCGMNGRWLGKQLAVQSQSPRDVSETNSARMSMTHQTGF